jgi:hypothetical protein
MILLAAASGLKVALFSGLRLAVVLPMGHGMRMAPLFLDDTVELRCLHFSLTSPFIGDRTFH